MSEVLKRLSDIPTSYTEKQAKFDEEKAASKRRNVEASRAKLRAPVQPRKQPRREGVTTITWLPERVPIMPGSRVMVCGVASDASDACKAAWMP
jgi:hypothetical protein